MNDISLDVPTVTRYALGDMPDGEIRLLKLTHAAPGAAQALQEEAAEIQQLGQWLTHAYATEPLPASPALTAEQRARILQMAATPLAALPSQERQPKPKQTAASVERAIALRAGLWTFGAAAAVVALLFWIQTPADSVDGQASSTADGPSETTTGKFKIHKARDSEKPFDSTDVARRTPNQLPLPPVARPTAPEIAPAPATNAATPPPIVVDGGKPQKITPPAPQRGPVPVQEGVNGADNKSFASPKP
jgi:hypothetical protein